MHLWSKIKPILLIAIFSVYALGQQYKAISEKQYDQARENAFSKMEKIARRETSITKTITNGKVVETEVIRQEYNLPDSSHWYISREKNGSVTEKSEIIYIGKAEYRKEGEGAWKIIRTVEGQSDGPIMSISGKEVKNLKQFLVSSQTIEGKPMQVFSFYRVYDFGLTLQFYDSIIMMGSDGLITKEYAKTSQIFPDNVITYETTTYEYSPADLEKIVAPVK